MKIKKCPAAVHFLKTRKFVAQVTRASEASPYSSVVYSKEIFFFSPSVFWALKIISWNPDKLACSEDWLGWEAGCLRYKEALVA